MKSRRRKHLLFETVTTESLMNDHSKCTIHYRKEDPIAEELRIKPYDKNNRNQLRKEQDK